MGERESGRRGEGLYHLESPNLQSPNLQSRPPFHQADCGTIRMHLRCVVFFRSSWEEFEGASCAGRRKPPAAAELGLGVPERVLVQ